MLIANPKRIITNENISKFIFNTTEVKAIISSWYNTLVSKNCIVGKYQSIACTISG